MMVIAPLYNAAEAEPATARPTIKAAELGAAAQMMEPTETS